MPFEKIHLIHPASSAAEQEYTKKFLRMIGCQVYTRTVDDADPQDWGRKLRTINEPGGIDIILNYRGLSDSYQEDCLSRNVQRIYFHFNVDSQKYGASADITAMPIQYNPLTNIPYRYNAIMTLIDAIWKDNPNGPVIESETCKIIKDIFSEYAGEPQNGADRKKDLFFMMQAKRCLRVLSMGEVLQDEEAKVDQIPLDSYLLETFERLFDLYAAFVMNGDIYSLYTCINAALAMWGIRDWLSERDRQIVKEIVPEEAEVSDLLNRLTELEPDSISVLLMYTRVCHCRLDLRQRVEKMYQHILQLLPSDQPDYAYIWYRVGHFYEKQKKDSKTALEYYAKAVEIDPKQYQAQFKLGYYAALDGRYIEAENWLNKVVLSMFHGRDSGPGEDETYPNWKLLSLKDAQYAYKAFVLQAKIAIRRKDEYSAKALIGKACMAGTTFEDARLEDALSFDNNKKAFMKYHMYSKPVWCIWKVLFPWSENVIQDDYVKYIVRNRLKFWQ